MRKGFRSSPRSLTEMATVASGKLHRRIPSVATIGIVCMVMLLNLSHATTADGVLDINRSQEEASPPQPAPVPSTPSHESQQRVPLQHSLNSKQLEIVQRLIATNDFLGLFSNADTIGSPYQGRKNNYIINDAVNMYLVACCNTKEASLSLFRAHGFEVKDTTAHIDRYRQHEFPDAEEVFVAQRPAVDTSKHVEYAYEMYQVILIFKGGCLQHIVAKVYIESL